MSANTTDDSAGYDRSWWPYLPQKLVAPIGHDGFSNFNRGFKGAFSDIKITEITHQVATENDVVSEFKARGTHTGPLLTPAGKVPPTGRTVDFTVCEVWSVKNGKVASLRNYQDAASIMRQLGLA